MLAKSGEAEKWQSAKAKVRFGQSWFRPCQRVGSLDTLPSKRINVEVVIVSGRTCGGLGTCKTARLQGDEETTIAKASVRDMLKDDLVLQEHGFPRSWGDMNWCNRCSWAELHLDEAEKALCKASLSLFPDARRRTTVWHYRQSYAHCDCSCEA